jgi:membrane protease YdiL (CAAX protease family)
MDIPVMLVVWSVPSLVSLGYQRCRGAGWRETLKNLGLQGCTREDLAWALGFLVLLSGLSWVVFQFIPADIFQNNNLNTSFYAGWTPGLFTFLLAWTRETLYAALGEEIFFRGWLGGWLVRRLGFWVGNTLQALIFLLPHLILLTISPSLWPLNLLQFAAGWLQGWLRVRSGSILPSTLTHSLSNAFGALAAMGWNQ